MINLERLRDYEYMWLDTEWVMDAEFAFLRDEDWLTRHGYDGNTWVRREYVGERSAGDWELDVSIGRYPSLIEFASLGGREQIKFIGKYLLELDEHEQEHFLENLEFQTDASLSALNFYRQYWRKGYQFGDNIWSFKVYHNFVLTVHFLRELNSNDFKIVNNFINGVGSLNMIRNFHLIHWAFNDCLVYAEYAGRGCIDRIGDGVREEFVNHANSIRKYLPEVDYLL